MKLLLKAVLCFILSVQVLSAEDSLSIVAGYNAESIQEMKELSTGIKLVA